MTHTDSFSQLFEEWKREHTVLEHLAGELGTWMNDDFRRGNSLLAEATARLRGLHERLNQHFDVEDSITDVLAEDRGVDRPEINGLREMTASDHRHLATRLRSLINRLDNAQSQLQSRQEAIDEFNLILDAIEQHEEQEAAQVNWLRPK